LDKLEGEFSRPVAATTKSLPRQVAGFAWKAEGDRAVLQWEKSKEVDIAEYIIYRRSFFGWQKIGATQDSFFILARMKPGDTAEFTISARDADDLEGPKSDPLMVQFQ